MVLEKSWNFDFLFLYEPCYPREGKTCLEAEKIPYMYFLFNRMLDYGIH